eukprot:scaffold5467_cov120-Amphora_coffeaeformis.AAC.1
MDATRDLLYNSPEVTVTSTGGAKPSKMANNNSNAVVISSWNNRVPYPSQAEFDRRAQDAFSREKEQKRVYSRAALKAITYGFQLAASSEAFSSAKGAYDAYLVRRKIDKQSVKTYKSIYNECKKVDSKIEVVNRVLLHNGLEATAMEDFYSVVVAAIESLPIERRFLENLFFDPPQSSATATTQQPSNTVTAAATQQPSNAFMAAEDHGTFRTPQRNLFPGSRRSRIVPTSEPPTPVHTPATSSHGQQQERQASPQSRYHLRSQINVLMQDRREQHRQLNETTQSLSRGYYSGILSANEHMPLSSPMPFHLPMQEGALYHTDENDFLLRNESYEDAMGVYEAMQEGRSQHTEDNDFLLHNGDDDSCDQYSDADRGVLEPSVPVTDAMECTAANKAGTGNDGSENESTDLSDATGKSHADTNLWSLVRVRSPRYDLFSLLPAPTGPPSVIERCLKLEVEGDTNCTTRQGRTKCWIWSQSQQRIYRA